MGPKKKSIAVLPFRNISGYEENEYFSDGVSEEIINALSTISGLLVTSRTSSFAFKNQDVPIPAIAQKLNVSNIVEGSVRRVANQVRISVHLINAEQDYQYWSGTYDEELKDIFELQTRIALDVAEKFRERSGHFEIDESLFRNESNSVEAYELYLKANHAMRDMSKENIELALSLLDQAISMEPDNASYYGRKSFYLAVFSLQGALTFEESYEPAYQAAERAILLNPKNADANAALAYLHYRYHGDLKLYQFYLNKSLESKPNNMVPWVIKSIVESTFGNYDECLKATEKLREIDPLSPVYGYFMSVNLKRLGQYDEALESVNNVLAEFPEHQNAYHAKGIILTRMGKLGEAMEHYRHMPGLAGNQYTYYTGLGVAAAKAGKIKLAKECLDHLSEDGQHPIPFYHENGRVTINLILGHFDEAFKEIEHDVRNKVYYLKFYPCNPIFDYILEDPRAKILEEVFVSSLPESVDDSNKTKYRKSGLTEQELKEISERLEESLEKEKLYKDSDISLKALAEHVGTTPNKLSEVINVTSKKNFFDHINTYRIKEIKNLLKDPESRKKYTILSLAFEAGFNSKSTFNASFKKLTGITPSEYARSLR